VKPHQLAQLAVVLLAAFAVFSFVRTASDAELRRTCTAACALAPDYAAKNRTAPDFELPALSGGKQRLSDYRGKTVVLNFWTKTCRPCLEEMPALAELAQKLRARRDVVVVTISTDETLEDARSTLASVLGGAAPPFAVLLDPENAVVRERYGTKLFPETWFIDRQGVIRARVDGARNWGDAMVLDFLDTLGRGGGCGIEFKAGRPQGPQAALCGELGS
jgi:peroxiredoxin